MSCTEIRVVLYIERQFILKVFCNQKCYCRVDTGQEEEPRRVSVLRWEDPLALTVTQGRDKKRLPCPLRRLVQKLTCFTLGIVLFIAILTIFNPKTFPHAGDKQHSGSIRISAFIIMLLRKVSQSNVTAICGTVLRLQPAVTG